MLTTPEISPLTEQDIAAIKAIGPAIDGAALTRDFEALFAHFTEDGMLMPPNLEIIRGREVILKWIKSFGFKPIEHVITLDDIQGYGDLAYARGTYAEKYTMDGVDEPIEDEGKLLFLLDKEDDGVWRIAIEMWNSDLPLPEGN